MRAHSGDFAEIGKKEISVALESYVQKQKGKYLVDTRGLDFNKTSLEDFQKILAPAEVEIARGKNFPKIISYYKLKNTHSGSATRLFSVVEIPFSEASDKILKVSQEVDFADLNQHGPFQFELYSGDKISKGSFLKCFQSGVPPMPPPGAGFMPPSPPDDKALMVYEQKSPKYSALPLLGENSSVVATLTVQPKKMPMPPGARLFENNFGIFIFFVGLVLSLLLAFYVQRNFIKPLLQLSLASKRVQKGDLDVELKCDTSQKEIKRTFLNFNQMCRDLREKEELRKSFIVNLTHDLRTPLIAQERSLSLFSQCFERLGLDDEWDLAKSLEKNNRHLLRMVNLILESYRFDSNQVKLEYTNVALHSLVENCFAKLRILADEKSVSLQNEVAEGFSLRADDTSLRRILLNLVSNSIENLSNDGFVKVGVETDGDFAKIYVEDNGCGIAQGDIGHIFDRYYTGKTLERKLGSGLGLDVCKKLVELHHGTISVTSTVDVYTKFEIKIPMKETL